jgi:MoaA/NifB/PqqE/SkfB family radical SAM enzyme
MSNKKQLFPIKTSTACLLKWNWSTIYFQSGTTSSCHRTTKLKIPENDFGSFHNLPEKIEDRQQMLNGKWPKNTCGYCKKAEDTKQYSDRMNQLIQQTDPAVTPPELFVNNTAVEVTPTFLEVYFRNTCNMSCVYCGPHFSSKWEEELKLHGDIDIFKKLSQTDIFAVQKSQKNDLYDQQKKQFWEYLEENNRFKILRYFSFLGGEPLVIPELEECLDFWENHPNEKLTFQIITNLKATDYRFNNFLSRIEKLTNNKKIFQFKVIASIDGIGPQTEYARYGIDTTQWMKNFEKLLKIKNLSVGINSAISILTLHEFPALLKQIVEWNKDRRAVDRIVHSFNIDSTITTPVITGPDVFKDIFKRCEELFIVKTSRELTIKKYWDGIVQQITNSTKDAQRINELKKYLSILDTRRNTNWKKTFPWLVDL